MRWLADLIDETDAALVAALARGRPEALDEVYRRHARAVRAVARRPLASADLAEEAVQEVFLQLWRAPDRFNPERGSLRTYLQAQAYRRAVDLCRSEASRRKREERAARRLMGARDVEEEVLDQTAALQLRRALSRLSANERQALELAYFQGHSYRQVAELLNQPEGTVKNRIRAGLRHLRSALPPALPPGKAEAETRSASALLEAV